jgi:hypothetical protein
MGRPPGPAGRIGTVRNCGWFGVCRIGVGVCSLPDHHLRGQRTVGGEGKSGIRISHGLASVRAVSADPIDPAGNRHRPHRRQSSASLVGWCTSWRLAGHRGWFASAGLARKRPVRDDCHHVRRHRWPHRDWLACSSDCLAQLGAVSGRPTMGLSRPLVPDDQHRRPLALGRTDMAAGALRRCGEGSGLEEVQAVTEAEEGEAKPSRAQVPDCQLQDRFQQLHDSLNNAGGSLRLRPPLKQAGSRTRPACPRPP